MIVAVVLLYFPFSLRPAAEVWNWYSRHLLYFFSCGLMAFIIGVLSHFLVKNKTPVIFFLKLFNISGQSELEDYKNNLLTINQLKLDYYQKQLVSLFTCSRCLAWWFACATGCLISFIYWPNYQIWWHTTIMLVFFSVLFASVGALVAVLTYFLQKNKKDFSG